MKKHILLFLLIVIAGTPLFSQQPFEVSYAHNQTTVIYNPKCIAACSDNGFITCGDITDYNVSNPSYVSFIAKADSAGGLEWAYEYESDTVSTSSSDHAFVVGESMFGGYYMLVQRDTSNGLWKYYTLSRWSTSGSLLWTSDFRIYGPTYSTAARIYELNGGGFIISPNTMGCHVLVRLDQWGNLIWINGFDSGTMSGKHPGYDVAPTYNEGFLMCGKRDADIYLSACDGGGNALWSKVYSNGLYSRMWFLKPAGSSSFAGAGITGTYLFTTKFDSAGNMLWFNYYSGQFSSIENLHVLPGGDLVVTGNTGSGMFIMKTDTAGIPITILRTDSLNLNSYVPAHSTLTPGGGYALTAGFGDVAANNGTALFVSRGNANWTPHCTMITDNNFLQLNALPDPVLIPSTIIEIDSLGEMVSGILPQLQVPSLTPTSVCMIQGRPETDNVPFLLYPNPVAPGEPVVAETSDGTPITAWELLDITGKQVASGSSNNRHSKLEIATRNLSEGMYLLKLTTPRGISAQKLVIR